MTTVVVARHGETEWTRDDRVQGWAPVPLSDRGRRQASALGRRLGATFDIDRLVTSDIRRCHETASAVLAELSSDPEMAHDPAWRERDAGLTQGVSQDATDTLRSAESAPYLVDDGRGETWENVRARVIDAWEDLTAALGDETAVVVTHYGPIANLVTYLRDQPPDAAAAVDVGETAVTIVDVSAESNEIRVHDSRTHLAGE